MFIVCLCSRLIGLAVLIADIILIVVEAALVIQSGSQLVSSSEIAFQILDLLFSAYFGIEVALRIVGLG